MKKLKIVLFKPRFIPLFIMEKTSKLILSILVCIVVAISPAVIKQNFNNDISDIVKTIVSDQLQTANIENANINDYKLSTQNTYEIDTYYFILTIGEKELTSSPTPIIQFKEESVLISLSGVEVYSITYQELKLEELNFSEVNSLNVKEQAKFYKIFNDIYLNNKSLFIAGYAIYLVFDMAFFIFLSALLMAFLTTIFDKNIKNEMPFKFKYKTALNCQYIYLFFVLLSLLYNTVYLQFVGNIFMIIYITQANKTIIVKKGSAE